MRLQFSVVMFLLSAVLSGCARPGQGTVALLSDYGNRDHYVGVLIGKVLRVNPAARIVPVANGIEPFNVTQGAFVLSKIVPEFPSGTVFLAVVDPGAANRQPIVAITKGGHTLVGPDNGLFDLVLLREGLDRIYLIENPDLTSGIFGENPFPGRDAFAAIAGYLSLGHDASKVGPELDTWIRLDLPEPALTDDGFAGGVLHVDRFGNILTNIPGAWMKESPIGTTFEVAIGDRTQRCTRQMAYGDVAEGEFVMLEDESGAVEIARNLEDAGRTLGVRAGVPIKVRVIAKP